MDEIRVYRGVQFGNKYDSIWNDFKNKCNEKNINYDFKNPKTIELTKDQYKVHEEIK